MCYFFLLFIFIFLNLCLFLSQVEAENPVEMVLVMTVEPGFGGQKFMPEMMDKVSLLFLNFICYHDVLFLLVADNSL